MTMVAVGAVAACSDDDGGDGVPAAGGGGRAGAAGAGGIGGAAGAGGAAGRGGSSGAASGSGGTMSIPVPPPTPALPADAPTVACPTAIDGSLDGADRSQTGRHSRIAPVAACGAAKGSPGTAADPSNPHLYDVYRFSNPSNAAVCFNFTLTYGGVGVVDAGADAGADASIPDGVPSGLDAGADAGDAGDAPAVTPEPAKYMTAYGTFFPTSIELEYRGDVGDVLTSPQAMGITVPAGDTIDVVVYAVDVAPAGVGSYTLSCSTL